MPGVELLDGAGRGERPPAPCQLACRPLSPSLSCSLAWQAAALVLPELTGLGLCSGPSLSCLVAAHQVAGPLLSSASSAGTRQQRAPGQGGPRAASPSPFQGVCGFWWSWCRSGAVLAWKTLLQGLPVCLLVLPTTQMVLPAALLVLPGALLVLPGPYWCYLWPYWCCLGPYWCCRVRYQSRQPAALCPSRVGMERCPQSPPVTSHQLPALSQHRLSFSLRSRARKPVPPTPPQATGTSPSYCKWLARGELGVL